MKEQYIKIFGIILFVFCFFYGAYIAVALMRNRKQFVESYKTIDFIKLFGNFGRILYVLTGIALCIVSTIMLLKFFGMGPWAGLK